jgi:hypothetical protein
MPQSKPARSDDNRAVMRAAARLNVTMRKDRNYTEADRDAARNELLAAHLERAIRDALQPTGKGFKPLREDDRIRLAHLLLDG